MQVYSGVCSQRSRTQLDMQDDFCHTGMDSSILLSTIKLEMKKMTFRMILLQEGFTYTGLLLDGIRQVSAIHSTTTRRSQDSSFIQVTNEPENIQPSVNLQDYNQG